jgi:hypothetical protein
MTKPLQQIQQENRKFILEAIHGCSYEEALKKEYAKKGNNTISVPFREYDGEELTLSRVLLAFKNKKVRTCYGDEIIFNIAGSQFCGLSVEDYECYNTTYTVYGICLWNLELETLEEQSEETQRGINEFFND